jgi:hypothetical protein
MSRKQQPNPTNRTDPGDKLARNPLWDIANEIGRPDNLLTPTELISVAKERGVRVTWSDIYGLYNQSQLREIGSFFIPTFLSGFIGSYIQDRNAQSILDPCVGIGSLLLPIVEAGKISGAVGVGQNTREIQLAQAMATTTSVEWRTEEPKAALDKLGTFDLVISSPAWGGRATTAEIETRSGPIEVRDSESSIVALKAATHINDTGEAIFVLPNNFFHSAHAASARDALPKLGLSIHAIITLSAGTFSPFTAIDSNLVFISRRKVAQVFVGRLTPEQDPSPLLANLRKRKQGAAPELGRLVALENYRGWYPLVAAEEEQRLAERSGLTPVPLADIVEAVNLADRRKEDETEAFEDLPNAVYLPLIGTSPAVSALSDLRIKPHNYAQLVVNSDKAYAGFLAEFFNSALGRKTRDKLLSGEFIPKINKQNLLAATVYTLPLDGQKKAVDVSRDIRQLRLALEQLETLLWRRPVDAVNVQRKLGKLNEKDSFEAWLETMPFPLASILWRYRATADIRSKNEHLLHFFEAATMFMATVMTSAFYSDGQFFEKNKQDWFKPGKDNQYSLTKSSFGQWVHRCYSLAKTTRTLLNDKDTREFCLDLYGTRDAAKLAAVGNRNLYSTLEKAGGYRNLQAHGGITSEENEIRRLTLLEKELADVRALLGSVFEDWWLVRPGTNRYSKGVYHYVADKLSGTRQDFKQEQIETLVAMDAEELYIFDTNARQPIQLLHFFRMMSSPAKNACYFYNQIEDGKVHWVSYHFEQQSSLDTPDPSVANFIRQVEQ